MGKWQWLGRKGGKVKGRWKRCGETEEEVEWVHVLDEEEEVW